MNRPKSLCQIACLFVAWAWGSGCIERTVTINTVPDGATVYLNDQEVGKSPVTVPFTWYGDYDLVCRKDGCQALKTHFRLDTPWYQVPGVDLFSECFVPFTIRDRRAYEFQLAPEKLPSRSELVERAHDFQNQALFTKD